MDGNDETQGEACQYDLNPPHNPSTLLGHRCSITLYEISYFRRLLSKVVLVYFLPELPSRFAEHPQLPGFRV